MKMESPAWARLIRNYKRKPTLPFLIGALRDHAGILDPDGSGFEQSLWLLQQMATQRVSEEQRLMVYIELCGQLRVPVFSIVAESQKLYARACFPAATGGETRLCLSTGLEASGNVQLEEVADRLFHGYKHPDALGLHHYSCDRDKAILQPLDDTFWRLFDEEDRTDIITALSVPRHELN